MNRRHQVGSFSVQLENGAKLAISEAAFRACPDVKITGNVEEELSERLSCDRRFACVQSRPAYEIEVTMKFRLHPNGFRAALNNGNIEIFLAEEREPANCIGNEITT